MLRIHGSREAVAVRPRSGPAARVGQRCRVHWEEDNDWYEAVVRGYDEETKKHNLWYPYDQEVGFAASIPLMPAIDLSKRSVP